jgi:ParB family chromosome partitioning protein
MNDLKHIKTTAILDPRRPLRLVRKNSVEYRELVDSVKRDGILQPILVRPVDHFDWEVVEGAHRLEAAKEAGIEWMPCLIRELTDEQVSILQLKAQALRPEMRAADYAQRLQEIVDGGVTTLQQLSTEIGKSPQWIRKMMKLTKLVPAARTMVNRGEITIGNGKKLALLPRGLQEKFIEQAVVLSNAEFSELVRVHLKQYREMIKKGRIDNTLLRIAEPMPHLRSMTQIREEAEDWRQAGIQIELMEAETALDGWRACLRWLLHLDPISLREHETTRQRALTEKLNAIERRSKDQQLKQQLLGETHG